MSNQIKQIKVTDIVADESWNVRLQGWEQDPTDESVQSFTALKESISLRGVEVPITLAPVGGRSKKYRLVSGFRRFRAVTELGIKTVPAFVREFSSESEIRSANLRENQEREGLSTPDLCWGILQLTESYAAEGVSKTQAELATEVGVSQVYVGKMLAIANGLRSELLEAWRKSVVTISYNKVLPIAKMPKSEQEAAWKAMLGATEEKPGGERKGKKSDLDKLKAKAAKAGEYIARMAYVGIEPTEPGFGDFSWEDFFGDKVTAAQGKAMGRAAQEAYDAFLTEDEAEEADEE
jgi:ParB/RepB/Spo0J family partition protein